MSGLTGKIFSRSGRVGGARSPHPHVVVVELAQECMLVPAFTSGGFELERYRRDIFAARGVRPDQACVEIDNGAHVRFYDGRPAHVATWVVERVDWWVKRDLPAAAAVGEMDEAGLLLLLDALVQLMPSLPDDFSPHVRKRASRLLADLRAGGENP